MSQKLYFKNQDGRIDRAFNEWHRADSLKRFLPEAIALRASCIDLDTIQFVEYEDGSREPLALFETACDVGQRNKAATVTTNLARRAGLCAYAILYTPADTQNPADPRWPDIRSFRIKRLWPHPERGWRTLTPAEFARALQRIREWSIRKLERERQARTRPPEPPDASGIRW